MLSRVAMPCRTGVAVCRCLAARASACSFPKSNPSPSLWRTLESRSFSVNPSQEPVVSSIARRDELWHLKKASLPSRPKSEKLWRQYVQSGQGADELFRTLLDEDNNLSLDTASTKSSFTADVLLRFLEHLDPHDRGVGVVEMEELRQLRHRELSLKDFKSWIRHATHDWSVHV